ncbi:MAG: hypothetical protein R6V58_09460 [Planctomycetota bacterium]
MRRGDVDPELLARLDIDPDQGRLSAANPFDRSKTEGKELETVTDDGGEPGNAEKAQDEHEPALHEETVRPEVVEGADLTANDLRPDRTKKMLESGEIDVSPIYRRLIDHYFGQLSEQEK